MTVAMWKLEKAMKNESLSRKSILTDGFINAILSSARFTTRQSLWIQTFRHVHMVIATTTSSITTIIIIIDTAILTTVESRAMETTPEKTCADLL
jgi:hypothetical protein